MGGGSGNSDSTLTIYYLRQGNMTRGRSRKAWADSYRVLQGTDCDAPLDPEDLARTNGRPRWPWCATQPDLVRYRGECLVYRAEVLQLRGQWRDAARRTGRVCVADVPAGGGCSVLPSRRDPSPSGLMTGDPFAVWLRFVADH